VILSAVIPTIDGREGLLEQTIASLAETANVEVELLVVRNAPTIGEAWNEGVSQATGSHLWLGADDVTFVPGWVDAAVDGRSGGGYPCPRILRPDGSIEACGTMGQGGLIETEVEDGFPCVSSPFPFMWRRDWETIGPALPIHYYCDDYLGFRARVAGLWVHVARDYTLIHHEGTAGRGRMVSRAMQDRQTFLKTIAEEHACLPVAS
jgi:GT2 family glycosyltransferase